MDTKTRSTLSVSKPLAQAIRDEIERRGGKIQELADEVIRTGLRVKRIPIEGE